MMGPALSSAILFAIFKDAEGLKSNVTRPFESFLNAYAGSGVIFAHHSTVYILITLLYQN